MSMLPSGTMLVLAPQPSESFRNCIRKEDGAFLGRAYRRADVEELQAQYHIREVNWGTAAYNFPGGANIDEELNDLASELRVSNRRLEDLKQSGDNAEYNSELENNNRIGQLMLRRSCALAHIDLPE
jgi:hypothetical protein